MKKLGSLVVMLTVLFGITIAIPGCGGGAGGTAGDKNDPEATTDEEMMDEESGDVEGEGGNRPEEGAGAA